MVRIRPAIPGDAHRIAEVHVASWRWAYADLLPTAMLAALSVPERESHWRTTLAEPEAGSGVLVAVDGSALIGFASYGAATDDDALEGTGEVSAIYLDRVHAGRGIGGALLEQATDGLRVGGFSRATLWVLRDNEPAKGFYEHAGWTDEGTIGEHRFDCGNLPVVRYRIRL